MSVNEETAEFESGKFIGRVWVTKKKPAATGEELARLNKFVEGFGADLDRCQWFCDDLEVSGFSTAQRVYFVMAPDDDGDWMAAEEFWEFVAPAGADLTPQFVEGFVVGALEAWGEVGARA